MTDQERPEGEQTRIRRLKRIVIGKARNVSDPEIFRHTTLIAFLAWVGLGADGLSSSAYGPEEAYKALGSHNHLAIILTAMTAITNAFLIFYTIFRDFGTMPEVFHGARRDFHASVGALGWIPLLLLILRAYSLGGGTYTGIEAVSNGVAILREPRVATARKTMLLMATSLAFTAGGIMFSYLLTHSHPVPGRTMNAVLLSNVFGHWPFGSVLIIFSLLTEAALLFVAAQTGFLDGPRILSNMAI